MVPKELSPTEKTADNIYMAFWVNRYAPVSRVKVSVFFALGFEVFLVFVTGAN